MNPDQEIIAIALEMYRDSKGQYEYEQLMLSMQSQSGVAPQELLDFIDAHTTEISRIIATTHAANFYEFE